MLLMLAHHVLSLRSLGTLLPTPSTKKRAAVRAMMHGEPQAARNPPRAAPYAAPAGAIVMFV